MGVFFEQKLPNCSDETTREATMETYKWKNCTIGQVCNLVKYSHITIQYNGAGWLNYSVVSINLQEPEVQHQESYINYDFQSCVSEIGGILGLTLGASILSMALSIWNLVKAFFLEKIKKVHTFSADSKSKIMTIKDNNAFINKY